MSVSSADRFTPEYSSQYPPNRITGEPQSHSGRCGKQQVPSRTGNRPTIPWLPTRNLHASHPSLHKLLLPQTDSCSRRLFSTVIGSPNFSDEQNVTAAEQSAQKQQHRSLTAQFALLIAKYVPSVKS